MNEKYQAEISEFINRFGKYRDTRIILYGIGRYTASLLEGLEGAGFHFVGLMDKDPDNLGKVVFGLPIVDHDTAEKNADMVIINTSETYWSVIYDRIHTIKIPVFYKNGELARPKVKETLNNPFKYLSGSALHTEIIKAQVVSFDFFDTLFMRSVCNPQDIFALLDLKLKEVWKEAPAFGVIRNSAIKRLNKNYSLDELYAQIVELYTMPPLFWENMKELELDLEKNLLIPRLEILSELRFALESNKEVYIISDMYLPKTFYGEILTKYGITVPAKHILLSNELNAAKADGSIWHAYLKQILKGRSALHVGDNRESDIEIPMRYGIRTYQTPGVWDLLMASSMRETAPRIRSGYDTAVMGCVLSKLFADPFVLEDTDGTVYVESYYRIGYCIFGPVILTFLLWLAEESKKDGITKLVFMSRDGYFLKENFEYLCELLGEHRECCYLGISRQLAMTAAIESRDDLIEFAAMPYTGPVVNLLEDRFGISNVPEIPGGRLEDYIEKYEREIKKHVSEVRNNYLCYIHQMGLGETCAVVDLGYYGNNQRYLNKLSGLNMSGYYFNANCSVMNTNMTRQKMSACFQRDDDPGGENSQVMRRMIFLESFLTAPYGMVKAVNKDGSFVCAQKGGNQRYFQEREMINQGVKELLRDYIERFGMFELAPNREFIDWNYGNCIGSALKFAENVKKIFFNDNAMMNRIESMLFY